MNLVLNREGYLVSEKYRQCVRCKTIYEITCKTITLCKKCNCERVKKSSPESKMLYRAKNRAKYSGIAFNITIEDIVIPEKCPILEIPLKLHFGSSGGKPNSPSLDRINNSLGYIKQNVIVISHLANCMKSSSNEENLLKFAEWVFKTYKTPVGLNEAY